jgi:hypothetical protein
MRIRSNDDLDVLRRSAQAYAVVATWCGAGLFAALSDGEMHDVTTLPGDPRALARSLPILCSLGLVVVDGPRVALTRTGRDLLVAGELSLDGAAAVLGDLSRLDAVARHGGPVRNSDGTSRSTKIGVVPDDPAATAAFMDMLYRRSAASADEVARTLAPRLRPGARVLDLGGGHGRYGAALQQRGCQVTLFDYPVCTQLARQRYGDTLSYLAGDFFDDPLGGPYDAIFLSNIVHGLDESQCGRLLTRLREVLVPGGLLAVKDMFLGEHGADPDEAAYFGLTMLMYTDGGKSYSVDEMNRLLIAARVVPSGHIYVRDQRFSMVLGLNP